MARQASRGRRVCRSTPRYGGAAVRCENRRAGSAPGFFFGAQARPDSRRVAVTTHGAAIPDVRKPVSGIRRCGDINLRRQPHTGEHRPSRRAERADMPARLARGRRQDDARARFFLYGTGRVWRQ